VTTTTDPGGLRAGMTAYALGLAGREEVPLAAGAEGTLAEPMVSFELPDYWPEPIRPRPSGPGAALELLAAAAEARARKRRGTRWPPRPPPAGRCGRACLDPEDLAPLAAAPDRPVAVHGQPLGVVELGVGQGAVEEHAGPARVQEPARSRGVRHRSS
jgi:hypothetical protein